MEKRILVLGGTGLLGEPVARQLQADGFTVRIMTRDPEKAHGRFGDDFELVAGDATNAEDVRRALDGCTAAHISVGGAGDLPAVQHVCQHGPAAGLERVGYVSGCTVCEQNGWFPMIAGKLAAEQVISDSGLPYTIFAPTWPMEMLARYARDGKPVLIGKQENRFHFFAVEDLARMVSQAYQEPAAANQRFVIHGPEAIPFKEALLRYCQAFFPEVEKVSGMPVWLVRLMARVTGNDMMKFGADLSDYFDKVGELGDPRPAHELLGAPSLTLDDWLAERSNGRGAKAAGAAA